MTFYKHANDRMAISTLILSICAGTAAFGLTGCGGSSSDSTRTASSTEGSTTTVIQTEEQASEAEGQEVADAEQQDVEQAKPNKAAVIKDLLRKEKRHFLAMEWDEMNAASTEVLALTNHKGAQYLAKEFPRSAEAIQAFITDLAETQERFERNMDVHPSYLCIKMRDGKEVKGVLIEKDGSIIETDDAAKWLRKRVKRKKGKVTLSMGSASMSYDVKKMKTVELADVQVTRDERRVELDTMIAEETADGAVLTPVRAYELASFAYANYLDDKIVGLLYPALDTDAALAATVRDDRAQVFFEKMVNALQADNKDRAASWMAQMRKHYEDTSIFTQAEAYYSGNYAQAMATQREEKARRREARKAALAKRRQLAEESGNAKALAKISKQEEEITSGSDVVASPDGSAPASGDEAEADKYYGEGYPIYAEAMDMPATPERNKKYKEAGKLLLKAVQIYSTLVEADPNNEELSRKLIQANQLRYGCMKNKTL